MASEPLAAYFAEAASWDAERSAQAARRARHAWVGRCRWQAGLCSFLSALGLALLMPLKRVELYVVRVDSSTGVVDIVPAYAGGVAPREPSVARYFLTHYITVCERFNFATAESDYEECGAFHAAQRNQAWYALWNPHNPASPLNVHKDGSTVRVQVQSVSFFQRGTGVTDLAQVRYLKAQRQAGGASDERFTHWIATIQYAFTTPSQDARVRRWNPLGFKVLELTQRNRKPRICGGGAWAKARSHEEELMLALCYHVLLLPLYRVCAVLLPPSRTFPGARLPANGDARIRTAVYAADEVYRLQGYVGFQIELEFERGESFIGLGAGDVESLAFAAQDNHLFLKPRAAGVDTNLTVLTNRRTYHFEYLARVRRADAVPSEVVYALRFVYAATGARRHAGRLNVEQRLSQAPAARVHNLDYAYCGSAAIQPAVRLG